jgi:hypothetical protein
METGIGAKIAEIIAARKSLCPDVQRRVERLNTLRAQLTELRAALQDLLGHPGLTEDLGAEIRSFLQTSDRDAAIAKNLDALETVKARLTRESVNIGVSGQARAGKSTLLQSISGLSEDQIPTGKGLPVTAVRSRIFNFAGRPHAKISFHGFSSFRQEVLSPYHHALRLHSIPYSLVDYRALTYPETVRDLHLDKEKEDEGAALLRRLKEMQQSLPSYEDLLVNAERDVDLKDLRQYVAYPTDEERKTEIPPRRYLAVKNLRIFCRFPFTEVQQLGLVDLPGLGEVTPDVEDQHVRNLKDEIDVVLFLKRPTNESGFWQDKDAKVMSLLAHARGAVINGGDFVTIVVNRGGVDQKIVNGLLEDIRNLVNEGVDGKHYRVLEWDAIDKEDVYKEVLAPLLKHISERLPIMDREVIDEAVTGCESLANDAVQALGKLQGALRACRSMRKDVERKLLENAKRLRAQLAESLGKIVDELLKQARREETEETELFESHAQETYEHIKSWISNGFGMGPEEFRREAYNSLLSQKFAAGFAGDQLNFARVEIGNKFCRLDTFFEESVARVHGKIGEALSNNLGQLLSGLQGKAALQRLMDILENGDEGFPTLVNALRDIVALEISYRNHFHPRVRKAIDSLAVETADSYGNPKQHDVAVPKTIEGAEALCREIEMMALNAAWEAQKALFREQELIGLILHAAAEHFEDAFIRSRDSEYEFQRLARSFRDDIWPGEFEGIDADNARAAKTIRLLKDALEAAEVLRNKEERHDGGR